MATCPFATFEEITGPVGPFAGGPFKIVHHTTEGSTYASAKAAYKANKSDPHFTVTGDEVFQHIDTALAARSLKNPPGGVETNRDSAVQIEVVGFAGKPKDVTTLRTVANLCRWIEAEHGVAQTWPNGKPKASTNGNDPGGHNRDSAAWDNEGGHYGHSQVPENKHWDPGYTEAELAIVTPDAVFDAHDELAASAAPGGVAAIAREAPAPAPESADAILQRVLAGLAASADSGLNRRPSRITVSVKSAGVEVQVVIEGANRR
jgi:hypothetical protein